MSKPVLIDAFCGLGGSTKGYQRAGFHVIGCDIVPQPDYCGDEFVLGDAIKFIAEHGPRADAAHGSPPCQGSSAPTRGTNARRNAETGRAHPMLIEDTRAAFEALGIPYVIENVQGSTVRRDLTLCGEMFGLIQIRHRYFELGDWSMPQPVHVPHRGYVRGWRHGVYRDGPYVAVYGKGGGKATTEECREAQGINWSWDRNQLVEAIPPAFTEYVGRGLIKHLAATTERAA